MKKFVSVFLFACIASMQASVSAQILQRDVGSTPSRTVTKDDTGVTVSYILDGMRYVEDDLYPGSYRIDVPGFGHNMTLTEPVYPFRWDSFEIPEGCSASVSVVSETNTDMPLVLAPAREPLPESDYTGYSLFQDNPPIRDSYEDERFVKTCEDIRGALLEKGITMSRIYTTLREVNPKFWNNDLYGYGDEIPLELQKPNFAWDGNKNDIISQINSGVLFALHRDHGEVDRWTNPIFRLDHLNQLNNGNLTPVVFSINCLTGSYQTDSYQTDTDSVSSDNGGLTTDKSKYYPTCLAERFLSIEDGAVGVFAASSKTYSGTNDALTFEMLRSVWPTAGFPSSFPSYGHLGNQTVYQDATLGAILKKGK